MAWYDQHPHLVTEIRSSLYEKYPTLHLLISKDKAEVFGIFPVFSSDGEVLDRYNISIELLSDYPKSLPIVREIEGRLPWKAEYHIELDGKACVIMPDDRWRCFPTVSPFIHYLDGPLHNFFLGQSVYAKTGEWPFGEWGHGNTGIYEYYQWLLNVKDNLTVQRFLHTLAKNNLKKHYECPCGSGQLVRKCCVAQIRNLRDKIHPEVASHSVRRLGGSFPPYKRSQLR